jgi:hypothetical protein
MHLRSLKLGSALFALALTAGTAQAGCTYPPTGPDLMRTVAQSDVIAEGSIALTPEQLSALRGKAEWVDVPFAVTRTLKGPAADSVMIRFYPATDYAPALPDLELAAGHRVVVYLHRLVEAGPPGLYFAAGEGSLKPASESLMANAEIGRQEAILKAWAPDASLPHSAEVKALLDKLAAIPPTDAGAADKQTAVLAVLRALGPQAVPAIVAQMDDRRPLAAQSVAMDSPTPENHYGVRNYHPKTIVDALDAELNQVTGEFGTIYNGGSDAERDSAVRAWRVYAHDLTCG